MAKPEFHASLHFLVESPPQLTHLTGTLLAGLVEKAEE